MTSFIGNCLAKLVNSGQITQAAADAALALHEGIQGKLSGDLPPTNADAAAALEAARAMADAARKQKAAIAKDAIALSNGIQRTKSHPKSAAAGILATLTRDINEMDGGINVESLTKAYQGKLQALANDLIESYNSKFAGVWHDYLGPRNVIRELRGTKTGDSVAVKAADAFRKSVDEAISMAERAGVVFRSQLERDTWMTPQFWESRMVRKIVRAKGGKGKGENYVIGRWMDYIEKGELEIFNRETGQMATPLEVPGILQRALDHILINDNATAHMAPFNLNARIFNFKTAESFLDLMDEMGAGQKGYYPMLAGHLNGMASEIAMVSVWGRNYQRNFQKALELVKADEKLVPGSLKALHPRRLLESRWAAEKTFKFLTGELNAVEGEFVAGFFGALRNIATAANLGGAVITAIPGDTINAKLARQQAGIPAFQFLGTLMKEIATGGKGSRALAARLEVSAHAAIDMLATTARFGGELDATARAGRLAELVIRGQGLAAWTSLNKRIFSLEFLGHIAHESGKTFDQLDPAFQRFFLRHGIAPDAWDSIRSTELFDAGGGATYFDPSAMKDVALKDRLMSAIMDEREFAVLEAGARTKALFSGGARRGTLPGELARSAGMYKSFGVSILMTHGMRAVSGGNIYSRSFRLGKYLMLMTAAGAASLQAKSVLYGKDPRDMTDPVFWADAFVTGGGSGIYGDVLKQGLDPRYNTDLSGLMLGPPVQLVRDVGEGVLLDNAKAAASGESTSFGTELARAMRKWTPSTFYTRLMMDRILWDELQSQLDPSSRQSWQRQEQRLRQTTGQKFWWKPGRKTPSRAPDLSQAVQ